MVLLPKYSKEVMTGGVYFLIALCLVFCATVTAQNNVTSCSDGSNLMVNGGFETVNNPTNADEAGFTGDFLAPWVVTNPDIGTGVFEPHSGSRVVELNGRNPGAIAQIVNLTGTSATLSFAYSGHPFDGVRFKTFTLGIYYLNTTTYNRSEGQQLLLQDYSFDEQENDGTYSDLTWIEEEVTFSPPACGQYLFEFRSTTTQQPLGIGPVLDDVVLCQSNDTLCPAPSATPSPSPSAVPSTAPASPSPSPNGGGGGGNQGGNTNSPSSSPSCSVPSPSPSASPCGCNGNNGNNDVVINFYFADILNGLN
eukprot:TRINITY_DN261_c0_g1_i1.p1 TRINITY_DN261_c0_g1~~TRINITY_DN261_c0_g1_i1.p1  ORF type:complete len:308 (-),score=65.45 TRINITY_DN261_c0_g1_i1:95-1018(-)